MSSLNDDDPTLPVDFDGSTNPDQLAEVTLGTHLEYPDGSIAMVTKAGSGRMSPVRARTMKEYDQQIAELKKENFSLKLRIYFLEERMQQKFDGDGEDLFKTNIELKVEVESLKRDLSDKQDLLKKASTALESISAQHQVELVQARDEAVRTSTTSLEDVEAKVLELQNKLQQRESEVEDAQKQLAESQHNLQDLLAVNMQLEQQQQQPRPVSRIEEEDEDDLDTSTFDRGIDPELLKEKENIIAQLRTALKTKELIIEQQDEEKKDVLKDAQREVHQQVAALQQQVSKKDKEIQTLTTQLEEFQNGAPDKDSLQETLEECQKKIRDQNKILDKLKGAGKDKDEMIGKLEDKIREQEKDKKDLEKEFKRQSQDSKDISENVLKRDKAIQGLSMALQQKNNEVEGLMEQMEQKDAEVSRLSDKLHKLSQEKYQGLESSHAAVADKDDTISDLEEILRDKQHENQRLQTTIGRQEAEIGRMRQQLEKADDVLRQREDALQYSIEYGTDARDALQDEKQRNTEKSHSLGAHLQALLDDAQRQIGTQEKLTQRLTRSLQDKDRQLQEYMNMVHSQQPQTENKESLITSLRDQLRQKDKAIEDAMEEKYKALEERDNEIRQLKMALRERERDIERANQMLLTTEESIDTLENEAKEKEQTMKQLANALKAQQRALEDAADSHQRGIEEKEAMIERLSKSLAAKDSSLQAAVNESSNAPDSLVKQLQERLQDKEKLLQEMMSERSKSAESNEQAIGDLLAKLRARDEEIKDTQERCNKEVAEVNRQMQNLQADLNKKDYEIQTMENRASWTEEQQQEMLDKMRSAINEKDKTIEALVESAREKDKLFSKLQPGQGGSEQRDEVSAAKLAELQAVKDEVARLHNELHNKDDLVERLRVAVERRSPKPDMVPRRQLQQAEEELAQRTQNELRQILHSAGLRDIGEVAGLRKEVERLREELERPGTPQRSQTTVGGEGSIQLQQVMQDQMKETNGLNEALRAERDIYVTLNQSGNTSHTGQSHAFEIELSAVKALRSQLEEGVDKNSQLREALESQITTAALPPAGTVHKNVGESYQTEGALADQIRSLQTQLEESKRWNASLQSRLQQQQPIKHRGGGVGGANEPSGLDISAANETFGFGQLSFLPSFRELPGVDEVVPDDLSLSKMSVEQLQEVVQNLKSELQKAHVQNSELLQHVSMSDQSRDIPGENDQDRSELPHATQVEHLSQELQHSQKQAQNLHHQLDSILNSPKSNLDSRVIPVLKQQLQEAREELHQKQCELDELSQQRDANSRVPRLEAQLAHTEHLNSLLKRQIELDSQAHGNESGFNPELIVQMAQEIERLKEELDKAKGRLPVTKSDSMPDVRSKSKIPVASMKNGSSSNSQAQVALQKQMESMRTEINDAKVQNKMLSGKLASTEQTVRSQTEKMKYYRGLLEDTGLLPRSPQRSRSESNLSSMQSTTSESDRARPRARSQATSVSTENITHRIRDLSPSIDVSPSSSLHGLNLAQYADYGHSDSVPELRDQVGHLKSQLQRCSRVMRGLQYKAKQSGEERPSGIPVRRNSASGLPPSGSNPKLYGPDVQLQALQGELAELRFRLKNAERQNAVLTQKLEDVNKKDKTELLESIEAQKQDNTSLRKQLIESQNLCESFKGRLNELNSLVEDIVGDEKDLPPEVVAERAGDLQKMLGDLQELVSFLEANLEAPDDDLDGELVSKGGTGQEATSCDSTNTKMLNAEKDFAEAKKKNQELQKEKADLIRKVSGLQEQLLRTEAENSQLNQRLDKVGQGQKVKGQVDERIQQLEIENNLLAHQVAQLEQEHKKVADILQADQLKLKQLNELLIADREKFALVDREKEELLMGIQERDSLNAKLKDILRENTQAAEKLRDQIIKMSTDIEEKNQSISKLRKKLKHLQKRNSAEKPRSNGDSDSLHSDISVESMERARHMTDSTRSGIHTVTSSPEYPVPDSSGRGKGSGSDMDQDFIDFTSSKQPLHDSDLGSRSRYPSEHSGISDAPRSQRSRPPNSFSMTPVLQEENFVPVQGSQISQSGGSMYPSSEGDTHFTHSSRHSPSTEHVEKVISENDKLKIRLKTTEDLNESLRKELRLFENVKQQNRGSRSAPSVGVGSSHDPVSLGLEQHLQEIRALRKRLEESLENNDRLREQLEQQLASMNSGSQGGTTNVFLPGQDPQSMQREKEQQLKELDRMAREIIELKKLATDKAAEVRDRDRRLRELESRLKEKDSANHRLAHEKETLNSDLRVTRRDLTRLQEELKHIQDQMMENQELNKTLRLELSVYDKMYEDKENGKPERGGVLDPHQLDLGMLLEEIRQLRIQLVRTIENNNSLRQKLEEQLARSPTPTSSLPHTVNIHHHHATSQGSVHGNTHGNTHGNSQGIPHGHATPLYSSQNKLDHEGIMNGHTSPGHNGYPPDQWNHLKETGQGPLRTDDLTGSISNHNMLHPGSLRNQPMGGQDSLLSRPGTLAQDLASTFHSDSSMRYSIYDPQRPPGTTLPGQSHTAIAQHKIGSDLRTLYSIGELDDYELLKKEISESVILLNSMEARIKDRLRAFAKSSPSQSMEHSTLKSLSNTLQNLHFCLKEQQRLVQLFWISQLPKKDQHGRFVDAKMLKEFHHLQQEFVLLKTKYTIAKQQLRSSEERLQANNKAKEGMEEAIIKKLTKTHEVLIHARSNLERNQLDA